MAVAVSDPHLKPIAEKVAAGERLSTDDAVRLFESSDLLGIGAIASQVNRRLNGDHVFFTANQHINPTNVCVLRKTCVFCSFARHPKEEGAYTRSLDEVFLEAEAARGGPTREFHIVGGLHPKLRLDYYLDMFRGLKQRHPSVQIKALTAVEIAHLARLERMPTRDVLVAMKESGVDTLPGGGAEVFGSVVRATIADRKLAAADWLRVHREAHELGIPTNCTMLYGHVETSRDRAEHLAMLRQLQDEAPGFLTYIPLAYHPDHNELGEELGREGTATTGVDDLKNIAVGRLFLDNVPHVKTHWPMVTPFLSQVALDFGCDDLEGTVVYERVYHEAGAHTPMMMSYGEIVRFIRGAGKIPVERDSLYDVLRTFDDDDGGESGGQAVGRSGGTPREDRIAGQDAATVVPRHRGTTLPSQVEGTSGRTAQAKRLRLGRIGYINCYPVYRAIDRGVVPVNADLVTGTPAELNDLLAASELDVSVISAVEYARNAKHYHLLPDIAISCDGAVRSVALFSHREVTDLENATVLVAASSRTSVYLLDMLCQEYWGVRPKLVEARAEERDLDSLAELPHEAVLVIGDAALLLSARDTYAHRYDLGEVWKNWTDLPFVFAVWAARRESDAAAVATVHTALLDARNWGLDNLPALALEASSTTGISLPACRKYLSGLDYALSYRHLEGLTSFFRRLAARGDVRDGTLSFLSVA